MTIKKNIYIAIFFFLSILGCENQNLPERIKYLPNKLIVVNEPSELYAEKNAETGYYFWRHKTSVTSPNYDAKIIEFGCYNYIKGKWKLGNLSKKPYGAERFEIWYSSKDENGSWKFCTDALLKKGVTYTDVSNYSVKDKNLVERRGFWYYIAEKNDGSLIMGYGKYHANPKIKKQ